MNIIRRYHGSIFTSTYTKLTAKISNISGFVVAPNPKYLSERYIDANNKDKLSISYKGRKFEIDARNIQS